MTGEVLIPSILVIPQCTNAATSLRNEQGYLAYCLTNSKLGFVTSTGVSGELVTHT